MTGWQLKLAALAWAEFQIAAKKAKKMDAFWDVADGKKTPKHVWDQRPDGYGTILYGLDRISRGRRVIFIVEGASDCHTLWYHGFAALGVPGAGNFDPDRDDPHLDGIAEIVAFMEPDLGGQTLIKRLSTSKHRGKIKIATLEGFTVIDAEGNESNAKDVSELHIHHARDPETFCEAIMEAARRAVSFDALLELHPEMDATVRVCTPYLPEGYRFDEDGSVDWDNEGEWMWLCSPIKILAVTRDSDQRKWGILIMVKTPDGHWHRCALPRILAVMSGDELFGFLTELGLRFDATRAGKAALRSFILRTLPIQRALCVARTGWHGRAFVLPDEVIGDTQGERPFSDHRRNKNNPRRRRRSKISALIAPSPPKLSKLPKPEQESALGRRALGPPPGYLLAIVMLALVSSTFQLCRVTIELTTNSSRRSPSCAAPACSLSFWTSLAHIVQPSTRRSVSPNITLIPTRPRDVDLQPSIETADAAHRASKPFYIFTFVPATGQQTAHSEDRENRSENGKAELHLLYLEAGKTGE
jgi:hypothetical protein